MRLHRLDISGVGPFAAPVSIDFARLGDSGLFLLEGPTGSGKSTVLDAVSFALYGKLAQAGADAERLRSHFLQSETESFVDLSFTTQSGHYRIRRTPKYQRPKKRGDGLRTINPTALLWRLSDLDSPATGQLLSSRLDEVADEITRAVGLSHAQFVQTVILPQGEFANFLRAPTESKRTLLQKLFGTEVLARVQADLVEQRQHAERRRQRGAETLTTAVHAFVGAAAYSRPDDFDTAISDSDTDKILALAAQALTELTTQAEVARAAATVATADRASALARSQQLQVFAEHQRTRGELRQRLTALQEGAAAEQVLADEVSAAERAAPVAAVADAYRDAQKRCASAVSQAEVRRARLPVQWRNDDELTLRSVADQVKWNRSALDEHQHCESELLIRLGEARELVAERSALEAAAAAEDSLLTRLADELVDLLEPRERAAAAWATADSLRAEHLRASEILTAATSARSLQSNLAHAEADLRDALAAENAGNDEVHELRARRLESIAGELGLSLQSGEPCRVCGSFEHPAPAAPGLQDVTQQEVRAGEARLAELAEVTARRQSDLNLVQRRNAELQALAAGRSVAAAEAELEVLHRRLSTAVLAGNELAAFDRRREQLLTQQQATAEKRRANVSHIELLADRHRRCEQLIDGARRQLVDARAGFATVSERLIDLDGQLVVLDDAITHVAAAGTAQAELGRGRTALDKALAEAGLETDEAFGRAYRAQRQLGALRQQLAAIRAEWEHVQRCLAAPELADPGLDSVAPAQSAEELEAATATLHSAEAAAAQASAWWGSASDRLGEAGARHENIARAVAESAEILRATAPAIRLGNLVAGLGDNQLRMDLTTFVLVRRFTDIVEAANHQLRRISNGRYQLQHSDARQGNARSGLGLRVMDLRTDQSRDAATLSGGETFYVSLSLALGLADVVRAESGGVDLGTLFIDEGFGSLDSDVLDEVMSVLEGLRAGGRTVGVVSHVAELKSRIADRIEIRANPDGSSRLALVV